MMGVSKYLESAYPFLKDSIALFISTAAILIVLAYFGGAFSLLFYSKKIKAHGLYLLPATGLAVVGLGCGIPSFFDIPVDYSAPTLAVLASCVNAAVLLRRGKCGHNWHLNISMLNLMGAMAKIIGITLLAVICASIFEYSYPGNSFHSIWGSGDFTGYWDAADYLKQYGGTLRSYASQSTYGPQDFVHLWVLGAMKYASNAALAFFSVLPFIRTELVIVPLIVATISAALLLLIVLSEESGEKSLLPVILAAVVPFTYFCLYFSYLAQAMGTCLTMLLVLLLGQINNREEESYSFRGILAAALVGLAAMLAHESQIAIVIAVVAIYMVLKFSGDLIEMRRGGKRLSVAYIRIEQTPLLVLFVLILALAFPFSERMVASIEYYANLRPMVGWEWPRLPSVEDFIGMNVPYAATPNKTATWLLVILAVGFVVPTGMGLSRQKHALSLFSLLFAQSLIVLSGLWYVMHNVQNASHAVWKAASLFDWLIVFLFASGLITYWRKFSDRKGIRGALACIIAILYVVPILALLHMTKLPQMYNTMLVDLLRRHNGGGERAFILSYPREWMSSHFYDPVVKSTKKLPMTFRDWRDKGFVCDPNIDRFIWQNTGGAAGDSWDSEGPYRFGLPPRLIDLSKASGDPWLLSGFYDWEGYRYRWARKHVTFVLGHPTNSLSIRARAQMNFIRTVAGRNVSSMPMKVLVNGIEVGEIRATSGVHTYELFVPKNVISRCHQYAVVNISAKYDYHPRLNAQNPRMISWGAMTFGFSIPK